MNNHPNQPTHATKRPTHAAAALAGLAAAALLATIGCSGSVVHNYRTFQSALDRGRAARSSTTNAPDTTTKPRSPKWTETSTASGAPHPTPPETTDSRRPGSINGRGVAACPLQRSVLPLATARTPAHAGKPWPPGTTVMARAELGSDVGA